jgi:hypothetical protein
MPFGADITNKANSAAPLPSVPKKAFAPLACIANGNLRSHRLVSAQAETKTDEHMEDASAIMSVTSATNSEEMSNTDMSMASGNARGDTTVSMREPTSGGATDSEDSYEGVLEVL